MTSGVLSTTDLRVINLARGTAPRYVAALLASSIIISRLVASPKKLYSMQSTFEIKLSNPGFKFSLTAGPDGNAGVTSEALNPSISFVTSFNTAERLILGGCNAVLVSTLPGIFFSSFLLLRNQVACSVSS